MEVLETLEQVFAYNLRILRGGLTQADMAERLGVPLRTYQKFEAASVIPQAETRRSLASKLGVPETRLFLDPDLTKPTKEQAFQVLKEALGLK
jgi:transcriptional regulator with XRE-family HTH domain